MPATGIEWVVVVLIVAFVGGVLYQLRYGKQDKSSAPRYGGGSPPDEPNGPPQAE